MKGERELRVREEAELDKDSDGERSEEVDVPTCPARPRQALDGRYPSQRASRWRRMADPAQSPTEQKRLRTGHADRM